MIRPPFLRTLAYLRSETKLRSVYVLALFCSTTAALAIKTFADAYWARSGLSLISFHADDGWCSEFNSGVGVHCFGDYGIFLLLVGEENPYTALLPFPIPYPPLAIAIFWPFRLLAEATTPGVALWAYLTVLATALAAPMFIAFRNIKARREVKALAYCFGVVLTAPFLITIDRGNNIALLVPLLAIASVAFARGNYFQYVALINAMILLRPQSAILFIALMAHRKLGHIVVGISSALVLVLSSFLLFPNSLPGNIRDWTSAVSGYSKIPANGGLDLSPSHAISSYLPSVDLHESAVPILLILTSAFVFLLWGRTMPSSMVMLISTSLLFLSVSTTFSYYLVLFLPTVAWLLSSWTIGLTHTRISRSPHQLSPTDGLRTMPFSAFVFLIWLVTLIPPWMAPLDILAPLRPDSPPLAASGIMTTILLVSVSIEWPLRHQASARSKW